VCVVCLLQPCSWVLSFSQACYEPVYCTNCVFRSGNLYDLVLWFPQDFSCSLLINFVGTFWHPHDPCYTNNFRVISFWDLIPDGFHLGLNKLK
jgi:hypothetical protein